jgi:hypothetical protein
VSDTDSTCPACSEPVASGSRFCPSCGARLDEAPEEPGAISYSRPEPRLFGVLLPTPTFVLGCVVLLGSSISFATGSLVLGVMLLAFSAALFVLFYGAAERNPDGRIARGAVDGVERVTGWFRFGRESATAWSGAGRRVVRIKRELRRLRGERREAQLALGEAAYAEDDEGIATLRARLAQIDDEIAERERESADVVARARSRVDDERLAVTPTQVRPPESPSDPDGPPAGVTH